MGYHNVRFPERISDGSAGGPGFATQILETDSGAEVRIARWGAARRTWNVATGVRTQVDLDDLFEFFLNREGAAHSFRLKDPIDFTTAADHRSAHSATDHEIGIGNGVTKSYQLLKKYADVGGFVSVRNIYKPVSGTVLASLDGTPTTAFSVNLVNGIITFDVAPGDGVSIKAGCEFDIESRFTGETDNQLRTQYETGIVGRLDDVGVIEVVSDTITQDLFFFGGAYSHTGAVDFDLDITLGRYWRINITAASKKAKLPNPVTNSLPLGGPWFFVHNVGANAVSLRDSSDTEVINIGASKVATVLLGINATPAIVWGAFLD